MYKCKSQFIAKYNYKDFVLLSPQRVAINGAIICRGFEPGLSRSRVRHSTARPRLLHEVEDRNGQEGYAPAAFLAVILDTTAEEEESDATKKGQDNSTENNQIGERIGQEGERRKSYSAAVIDGIKRNTRIYVGDSIIRNTDSRLSKGEDVVVCLPVARIEHVTERVERIMGRGN